MTRVVFLLAGAGNGHMSTYYATRQEALGVVKAWAERQQFRINNGQFNNTEISLHTALDPRDPSKIAAAVLTKFIVGMYIAEDKPEAADRVADAMEKMINTGDEWKGE